MDRKRRRNNADRGPPYVPPVVHVQYSNLAPESRKKLVEKLAEWAEWQTDKYPMGYRPPETLGGALSCKPELLRPGRGKLPAWEDRPAAPSKPPSAEPQYNISYEQIGDEVPAYDRGMETPLRCTPRASRWKPHPHTLFTAPVDGGEVGEEAGGRAAVAAPAARANRCFNCGSYAHSVNDCFRAYNPQVVEQARRDLAEREGRSDYRSPAKRYFLVGAAVPGGGGGSGAKEDSGIATPEEMGDAQPGQLSQELRSMLGLGPLDPPPWLGRMQALGVPPGYLTREAATTAPSPAGPEAAPPLPSSSPPPLPGTAPPPDEDFIPCVATPSPGERGQQEGGSEQQGGRYVCNVQFPGVNAPIPEGADPGVWNMKQPGFGAAGGGTAGSWQPSRSGGEGANSSRKRRKFKPASEDFPRPGSAALSGSSPVSLAGSEARQKTKVLCTSGGRFSSLSLSSTPAQAGIRYRGGQTRLLSIPTDATYLELLMLMGRQSGSGSTPGGSHALPPIIRYQLPSQPDVIVDVLDSDDVALMLEEHREEQQQQAGAGIANKGARPHLYVEWPQQAVAVPGSPAASGRQSASPTARPSRPSPDSRGGRSTADSFSSEDGVHHVSLAPVGSPPLRAAKLQMIPPADVQLLSIQGTGTFGDTYRGIWHGSTDVAVKCWNRGVMGMQWNAPAAAWVEFAQASDQLAALRHPNLVQVFGVILPDFGEAWQEEGEESAAPPAALPAPAAPLEAPAAPAGAPAHEGATVGTQQQGQEQEQQQRQQQQQRECQPQQEQEQEERQQPPIEGAGEVIHVSTLPQLRTVSDAAASGPAAAQQLQHGASSGSLGGSFRLPMHTPALVMEFIPGASLRSMMERWGERELSPTACFVCARDVAKAMEYLHSKGVVHMALKSGNVLMSWTGPKPQAKVTAWGMLPFKLAACFSPGLSLRRGWWPWLAPEIFRDPARISEKVDVYSYGILLYELWSQRTPYQGEGWDFVDLVASSFEPVHVRPALPGSQGVPYRPEPAPGWRALMERCWAEDPEQRPSFKEVLRTLHGLGRQLKERGRHSKRQLAGVSEEPGPAGGE